MANYQKSRQNLTAFLSMGDVYLVGHPTPYQDACRAETESRVPASATNAMWLVAGGCPARSHSTICVTRVRNVVVIAIPFQ
jgi:hypothetical protein